MSAPEELRTEVGTISVVARYVPGDDDAESPRRGIGGEAAFDEIAVARLRGQTNFINAAMRDALGPDYTISRLTVETTSSVEIVAVIAVAYKALKNFNEIVDTLTSARDHLRSLIELLIYRDTPAQPYEYLVTGRLVTVPADAFATPTMQIPLGYPASVMQPAPAQSGGLIHLARQAATIREPIVWDRNAFLSRLLVPLAFLLGLVALTVGLLAAIRLI